MFINNMNNYYNSDNYLKINKSSLTPPNYVFGIVWPILYILMGISFFMVYNRCKSVCFPLQVFLVHMVFNLIWTYLFIKYKNKLVALVDIIIMIALLVYCVIEFRKYSVLASNILLPYLLWLCFATYLNVYIVINN
jgi:benzodiazapine receptor